MQYHLHYPKALITLNESPAHQHLSVPRVKPSTWTSVLYLASWTRGSSNRMVKILRRKVDYAQTSRCLLLSSQMPWAYSVLKNGMPPQKAAYICWVIYSQFAESAYKQQGPVLMWLWGGQDCRRGDGQRREELIGVKSISAACTDGSSLELMGLKHHSDIFGRRPWMCFENEFCTMDSYFDCINTWQQRDTHINHIHEHKNTIVLYSATNYTLTLKL